MRQSRALLGNGSNWGFGQSERGLQIALDLSVAANIAARLAEDEILLDRTADAITILLPIRFSTRGSKQKIVPAKSRPAQKCRRVTD